ncbi:MAG: protein-L-isoaspartate(D-aspartate) O-methyltransferase [Salinivirgaceae bacterium]|nr:protein-L-isoaspartate(D-aspartate) O-methyltransferase [Salinivirgaceae bacterium]
MHYDGYKEQGLRQQLVEEIKSKKINDTRVIDAIGKIPRHLFMDSAFVNFAYVDKAFPIGSGQTISQPYTVAFQTELLEIQRGDKVLEIGTGSGYQTAVLLELGAKVFTIERQRELFLKTQRFLPTLGYNPQFFYGDGYLGKPTYGPFDKILITAGAPHIPEKLVQQLKPGGMMVIPLGDKLQIMTRIKKTLNMEIETEAFGDFSFVPLLKGTAND